MKVAVFCSASLTVSPMFLSELEALGEQLAEDGHEVIYGGSNTGCMGALAKGVLEKKGRLTGVVPEMDFMLDIVQPGLTERHVVPTLSSRKEVMNRLADAFLVCPGGLGTLDEALEVMALKSVGTLNKPIIFYNFLGVWTPILESLDLLVEQRMISSPLNTLIQVLDNREQVRENLKHAL
ncbi:MAG: LOG family protein [Bdellovibrionales bacterium]